MKPEIFRSIVALENTIAMMDMRPIEVLDEDFDDGSDDYETHMRYECRQSRFA